MLIKLRNLRKLIRILKKREKSIAQELCEMCIRDREKTVQGVLDVVLQDKVFYEESGGGITLSGGEMLYQPDFALQLLLAAKEEGLHTLSLIHI